MSLHIASAFKSLPHGLYGRTFRFVQVLSGHECLDDTCTRLLAENRSPPAMSAALKIILRSILYLNESGCGESNDQQLESLVRMAPNRGILQGPFREYAMGWLSHGTGDARVPPPSSQGLTQFVMTR